jgi:hypothetical protein
MPAASKRRGKDYLTTIEAGVLRAENPNPRKRGERGDQFT